MFFYVNRPNFSFKGAQEKNNQRQLFFSGFVRFSYRLDNSTIADVCNAWRGFKVDRFPIKETNSQYITDVSLSN